jgi:hypothetical protein
VEFQAADLADTEKLAQSLCEVELGPHLLEHLHKLAKGSVRLIVVGLYRIEQYAKARVLASIDASDLPPGFNLFTGPAPERTPPRPEEPQSQRRRLAVVDPTGDAP